jgi:hypothetical protein
MFLDENDYNYFCLFIKSLGAVGFKHKTKIKFYTVVGTYITVANAYPTEGSGYMDGNLFRFHLSRLHNSFEGSIDLTKEPVSGGMDTIYLSESEGVVEFVNSLEAVPCISVDSPDTI